MSTTTVESQTHSSQVPPPRTDKQSLLAALALELKHQKLRAQLAAHDMINLEKQIEEKHAQFLSEQDRLSNERDSNQAKIALLRKQLDHLKLQLDDASNVRDEDAQRYFALLSSDQPSSRTITNQRRDDPTPRPVSRVPAELGVTRSLTTLDADSSDAHPPAIPPLPPRVRSTSALALDLDSIEPPAPYPRRTSTVVVDEGEPPVELRNLSKHANAWPDSFPGEDDKPKGWGRVFSTLRRKSSTKVPQV
ncbi:hypothetical protein JCM10212_000059 [Sporobolomyces blumeae]